jgi:hypothetical protein
MESNLNTLQGYMGTLPINTTFSASKYGGTTVLTSLAELKKPAKRILITRSVGDSTNHRNPNLKINSMVSVNADGIASKNNTGRFMFSPGWTQTDSDDGKNWNQMHNPTDSNGNKIAINSWDTQQLILTDEDRISRQ